MVFQTAREAPTEHDAADALLLAVRQFYDCAESWHCAYPRLTSFGPDLAARALQLHALNFVLWHHEDAARCPGVPDHEVAERKKRIDELNARRNAAVEEIDVALLDRLGKPACGAPLHTETPGTIVDRLSVLTLRILHTGSSPAADKRLDILHEQHDDLCAGLDDLLIRLWRGEVRFKVYRQFKSGVGSDRCELSG